LWFADDYPPGKTDFKDKLSVTVDCVATFHFSWREAILIWSKPP
jgi:hypothetical protein